MDFVQFHQLESTNFVQSSYCFRNYFEDAWIMDTGATQHMTHRKDFFWSYEDCHLNSIFLVDDSIHLPQGKGTVNVDLPGIGERLISNVWYVPTFKKNLLSLVVIRQLDIKL